MIITIILSPKAFELVYQFIKPVLLSPFLLGTERCSAGSARRVWNGKNCILIKTHSSKAKAQIKMIIKTKILSPKAKLVYQFIKPVLLPPLLLGTERCSAGSARRHQHPDRCWFHCKVQKQNTCLGWYTHVTVTVHVFLSHRKTTTFYCSTGGNRNPCMKLSMWAVKLSWDMYVGAGLHSVKIRKN